MSPLITFLKPKHGFTFQSSVLLVAATSHLFDALTLHSEINSIEYVDPKKKNLSLFTVQHQLSSTNNILMLGYLTISLTSIIFALFCKTHTKKATILLNVLLVAPNLLTRDFGVSSLRETLLMAIFVLGLLFDQGDKRGKSDPK